MGGSTLGSGDQVVADFVRSILSSAVSACSATYTTPGSEETQRKWCNFLMPGIFFNSGAKKELQSYVGTTVLPSSRVTS